MNILALLLFLITIIVIYAYHKHTGLLVPPQISVLTYLDQKYHWNAWGHWLVQFALVSSIGLQWQVPWWALMLPCLLYVIIVEFVIQKNGFDLDVAFDAFTHLSGAGTAVLFVHPIF